MLHVIMDARAVRPYLSSGSPAWSSCVLLRASGWSENVACYNGRTGRASLLVKWESCLELVLLLRARLWHEMFACFTDERVVRPYLSSGSPAVWWWQQGYIKTTGQPRGLTRCFIVMGRILVYSQFVALQGPLCLLVSCSPFEVLTLSSLVIVIEDTAMRPSSSNSLTNIWGWIYVFFIIVSISVQSICVDYFTMNFLPFWMQMPPFTVFITRRPERSQMGALASVLLSTDSIAVVPPKLKLSA